MPLISYSLSLHDDERDVLAIAKVLATDCMQYRVVVFIASDGDRCAAGHVHRGCHPHLSGGDQCVVDHPHTLCQCFTDLCNDAATLTASTSRLLLPMIALQIALLNV